ncbi:MAG: hypothetical protein AB1716_14285 [Planctomycetota bacterium]
MRTLKPIKSATGSWDVLARRAALRTELRAGVERCGWTAVLEALAELATGTGRDNVAAGLSALCDELNAKPEPGPPDERSPEEIAAAWAALRG